MTTKDFTANVISATKVVPDGNFKDSKASGIWDINEALDLIKGGNWPNVANISPSAFVDGLFSTDLWEGNGTARSITNGINLSGSGGLVWFKMREAGFAHRLVDTERGVTKKLESQATAAEGTEAQGLTAFNSDGFTIGTADNYNLDTYDLCSWTFRKQPKFFDIVTYTGNGTAGRTVAHNLGSVPGMIIIRNLANGYSWQVYHRGMANTDRIELDSTGAKSTGATTYWNSTTPSSTVFTLGTQNQVNEDGDSFVAYLFAHNDDDGGFGEPGDQDIIKCGSYTGNGSTTGPVIDLGFEPQWLLIKRATNAGNWFLVDNMRGLPVGANNNPLFPNSSNAESTSGAAIDVLPTGFQPKAESIFINASNDTYIYMAIRRGGMQTPTTASSVFAIDEGDSSGAPEYTSGFPVDMAIKRGVTDTDNWRISARLIQGINHYTNLQNADDADDKFTFDFQDGYYNDSQGANNFAWMWKRARGYFDVVCYTGGSGTDTISHNLGVAPEMIWVKNRGAQSNAARGNWVVYHSSVNTGYLNLHGDAALATSDAASKFGNGSSLVAPTSSAFTVADDYDIGRNSNKYIAYLFATATGVAKVGSYTGNAASDRVIDCGFTNGAKFVLIKDADQNGTNWQIFDTIRGLTSTKAELLRLNTTAAQIPNGSPSQDYHNLIEPDSSGFKLNNTSALQVNANSINYIFYAIANDPS